jgi:hypothetical protein
METLAADIIRRVKLEFPQDQVDAALNLLSEYGGNESLRVIRCIVHLSRGSESKLLENLALASTDYRDIIYVAEYDREGKRIHDFSIPFTVYPVV